MYHLGVSEIRLIVPTRITERIETDSLLSKLTNSTKHIEMEVELGDEVYTCGLDHSARTVHALETSLSTLERTRELITPDYVKRWDELISNRERVNRAIVLTSSPTSPRTSTLGIKLIGLDPDDLDNFFIKVNGTHLRAVRL